MAQTPNTPPIRAHWRHVANTIELMLPSAYLSPKPKRQIDWFSHFCTAHSSVVGRHLVNAIEFGHIGATWQIWLNLCFLRPTRVHNSSSKLISSAIFALLTAECRQAARAHWHHLVNTIALVHNGATWRIGSNLWFLWPTQIHNPNGKSIGSAVFAPVTAESPYTLQWAPLSSKIAPSHVRSGLLSNTWFLRPIQAHNPTGISIGSAVFA